MKMDMKILTLICFCSFVLNYTFACINEVPSLCSCYTGVGVYDHIEKDKDGDGMELQCSHEKQYARMFQMKKIPQNIISLQLVSNDMTFLNSEFFGIYLKRGIIRKLDFSDNKIEYFEDGTFLNFTSVEILNLTKNKITKLTIGMFEGMNELRVLYLSKNEISVLPRSVFSGFTKWETIYLDENPIVCNCLSKDFVKWRNKYNKKKTKKAKMKVVGNCIYPKKKSGQTINKLRSKSMDCSSTLDALPHFGITPNESQVVFHNDSISLRCEATDMMINGTVMSWKLNGVMLSQTNFSSKSDERYLSISYNVPRITMEHAGVWECTIKLKKIALNITTSITLTVLESNAQYCQSDMHNGSKGYFPWPRAVTGVTTELECERCEEDIYECSASRRCEKPGRWRYPKYEQCSYLDTSSNHVSKMLKIITNMTESEDPDSDAEAVSETCQKMVKEMYSRTDIQYKTAVILPLIANFFSQCSEIMNSTSDGPRVRFQRDYVHVLSLSMEIPWESIVANNVSDDIMLQSRNAISEAALSMLHFNKVPFQPLKNLNLTALVIPKVGQSLVCDLDDGTWEDPKKETDLQHKPRVVVERFESCNQIGDEMQGIPANAALSMAIFANANFFNSNYYLPVTLNESNITHLATKRKQFQENPNLLADAANMEAFSQIYLVSPVYWLNIVDDVSMLNISFTAIYSSYKQVHLCRENYEVWKWETNQWNSVDRSICRTVSVDGKTPDEKPLHAFTCTEEGVYAVVLKIEAEDKGMELKSNLFVAISACIFTLSLLFIIATQVIFSTKLKSTRERRHILISTLVHMITAVMSFSFGIWKTKKIIPCYITGITIHYSSLSVLMWIAISTKLICRDVRSLEKPRPSEARKNKPLLRFYLVACGLPAIICSITAATNIENYLGDDRRYCWLSWNTSLYAFYLPAVAISIACIYKFIRALTSLTRAYKKNYSDPSNLRGPIVSQNGSSCHNGTINEETPLRDYKQSDESSAFRHHRHNHRTPTYELRTHRARLCGAALPLTSLIILWVFAGFSVAAAFFQENEKDAWKLTEPTLCWVELNGSRRLTFEMIFSCSCILFSLLHLIHHIYLRKEAWQSWKDTCCYNKLQQKDEVGVVYHSSDGNLNPISQRGDASTNVTDVPTTTTETTTLDVNNKKTKEKGDKYEQYTSSPATTTFGGEDYVAASEKDCNSYSANQQNSTVIVHQYQGKSKTSTSNSKISSHCKSTCSSTHVSNQGSSYMASSYRQGRSSRASDNSSCQQPQQTAYSCYQYNCQQQQQLPTNRCRPLKLTNLKYQRYMKQRATANGADHQDLLKKNVGHLDTRFLAQRHSRVRKALEERRKNQKKLTVLREHAQDSLTSNDESPQQPDPRRMRELPQSEQAATSSRINGDAVGSNEVSCGGDQQRNNDDSWGRHQRKPHGYLTVSGLFRIQKPPQSPSTVSDPTSHHHHQVATTDATVGAVNRDDVLPAAIHPDSIQPPRHPDESC